MTVRVRYVLEYIPTAIVEKLCDAYRVEIADGASVWVFVQPEDIAKERICRTEKEVWENAQTLLPMDEFGEIHVFEQRPERLGTRNSWETVRRSCVTQEDTAFEWRDCCLED